MIALFRARVKIGVSRLGRCSFITITYKADVESRVDVAYVRKDWAALWRRMRVAKSRVHKMKWIRVIELTKKRTPHHHLILGPIGVDEVDMCMPIRSNRDAKRYWNRLGNCGCLSHEFSGHWYAVTGDSYIVHARGVVGEEDAAKYLGKYISKGFMRSDREMLTGMARRWSSSVGWPGNMELRLAQTTKGGWEERLFRRGKMEDRFLGGPMDLLERVGEDIVMEYAKKAADRKQITKMRRYLRDSDVREATVQ